MFFKLSGPVTLVHQNRATISHSLSLSLYLALSLALALAFSPPLALFRSVCLYIFISISAKSQSRVHLSASDRTARERGEDPRVEAAALSDQRDQRHVPDRPPVEVAQGAPSAINSYPQTLKPKD